VTEFIDAPSHPPPGMTQERWAELSEKERVIASSILADIASDELSVAEKEGLYRIFKEAKKVLLELTKE
jgi:hypothetical protein